MDNSLLVGVIIDKYETYLANGLSKDDAVKLTGQYCKIASQQEVEELIGRYQEIQEETLSFIVEEENVENNKIIESLNLGKILSKERLILEKEVDGLSIGLNSEKLEVNLRDETEIDKIDLLKINNKAKDDLKKIVEYRMGVVQATFKTEEFTRKITDSLVNSLVNDQEIAEPLKENKVKLRAEVEEWVDKLIKEGNDKGDKVKIFIEKENGREISDNSKLRIETMLKATNVMVNKWIEQEADSVGILRKGHLKKKVLNKVLETFDGVDTNQKEIILEYADLITDIYYFENDDDQQRRKVIEAAKLQGLSQGQIESILGDVKVMSSVLKMNPAELRSFLDKYKTVKKKIKWKTPINIKEVRAVENIMFFLSDDPKFLNLLNFTQKYLKFRENFELIKRDWSTKDTLSKVEFMANSLNVMSKHGVKKGMEIIFKQILSGGVKATAGAAKIGGAAGLASLQAVPVVGQIALALTVIYSGYKKRIKPIVDKLKKMLGTVGIEFGGMKRFLQENFGKFFGGVLDFGIKAGALIVGIPAAIAASITGLILGPIIIFVFIGIFAYSILNNNLISSLVPPVRISNLRGGGTEFSGSEGTGYLGGECSVGQHVVLTKQCDPRWRNRTLPGGWGTYCSASCGPASVSMILQRVNSNLTLVNLLTNPLYNNYYRNINGNGSNIYQAAGTLRKFLGNRAVTLNAATMGCNRNDVKRWICDRKIVVVVASFYKNTALQLGGHFILGVAVENGEVVSADPYYDTKYPMNGTRAFGYINLRAGMSCILVDPTQYQPTL